MLTEGRTMYGKKIKYYRLKKGLTTQELADSIGLTKSAISQYENDKRDPNNTILKKISEVLGVSWVSLEPHKEQKLSFQHFSFRKLEKAHINDIELLKMDIENRCANIISLSNLLEDQNHKPFKPRHLEMSHHYENNANEIRNAINAPAIGPLHQLSQILERAGIIVLAFPTVSEINGLNGMVNNIHYIYFNTNATIERQRFSIAHELCHIFFKNNNEDKEFEKYINTLTGYVLIPQFDLYHIFGNKNNNINVYLRNHIAKTYKTSPSCLVTRLKDAGIVNETYYQNFFKHLNATVGRKNEQTQLNDVDSEIPQKFTNQVYFALSKELISTSKAAEYLNIPLYEVMQNSRIV